MNMKMPDFNVKKLVKEAGSTLSRVVQVKYKLIESMMRKKNEEKFRNVFFLFFSFGGIY